MLNTHAVVRVRPAAYSSSVVAARLPSFVPELRLHLDAPAAEEPQKSSRHVSPKQSTELANLLLGQQVAAKLVESWRDRLISQEDRMLAQEIAAWKASGESLKMGSVVLSRCHLRRGAVEAGPPPTRRRLRKIAENWYLTSMVDVRSGRKPPSWDEFVHSFLPAPPPPPRPPDRRRQARAGSAPVGGIEALILIVSLPFNAWVASVASESGKDSWKAVKRGVARLCRTRFPARQGGQRAMQSDAEESAERIELEDAESGVKIQMSPDLPDAAWQHLATLQLPPAPPGVVSDLTWHPSECRWQLQIRLERLPLNPDIYVPEGQRARMTWDPTGREWDLMPLS